MLIQVHLHVRSQIILAEVRLIDAIADLISKQTSKMYKIETIRHIRKYFFVEFGVIDLVHRQIYDSHSIPNHGLRMIRELLRHHQQRKMLVLLVVEELNRILI